MSLNTGTLVESQLSMICPQTTNLAILLSLVESREYVTAYRAPQWGQKKLRPSGIAPVRGIGTPPNSRLSCSLKKINSRRVRSSPLLRGSIPSPSGPPASNAPLLTRLKKTHNQYQTQSPKRAVFSSFLCVLLEKPGRGYLRPSHAERHRRNSLSRTNAPPLPAALDRRRPNHR